MNIFKSVVISIYAHYRKKNESSVAAFHARVVLSFALLLYFSIIFILLKEGIKWSMLSSVDLFKNKVVYLIILILFYVLVHFLSGSINELEERKNESNKNIRIGFFVFSIIALIVFLVVVPAFK